MTGLNATWYQRCLSSAVLGAILVLPNSTLASEVPLAGMAPNETTIVAEELTPTLEQINQYTSETASQVTSVSQLSDVQPTDWAFQALQSLIERYGVVAGNPDGTFGGNRAMTRYEFAAALNAALNQVNQLIAAGTADLVRKEDLATLQRLQEEFATELVTLRGRTDNLEARTTQLEGQQFSTTTKFTGEIIFALSGVTGGEKADDDDERVEENVVLSDRVRLNFDTSFSGSDRLRIRLQARNTPRFDDAAGTNMARLGFDGDSDNEVDLRRLEYRFPVGEQAMVYLQATGGEFENFTDTITPFNSSSRGSISRFGRINPIYRQSFGAGVGLRYEFSEAVSLSLGYVANDADDPESGIGGSPYGAIAQLTLEPNEDINLGLTYVRSYNSLGTGTGSELANDPFDDESDAVTANSYGVEAAFEVSSAFTLGGWVGFTEATAEDLSGNPEASIFNYAVSLAFPDIGKEGSLAGIVIGQPPKVTRNELGRKYKDEDTSLHFEVFYRFQATDNIAITPGLFVIVNSEHDKNNDTVYVGTIRTTFSF